MSKPSQTGSEPPNVPWPEIVKFIRQLSHDIRNNLNAVELQSAFLAELAEGDEMKNEVQRLRRMVSEVGSNLQRLTAGLSQTAPSVIAYSAAEFVEDLKKKLEKDLGENAAKVNWEVRFNKETLKVDPQQAQQALVELFANAFQHERNIKSITAKAYVEKGRFVVELREPKTKFELATKNWGREPLRNVSQGHYGLGLNRARAIAEAHEGELIAEYDRGTSTLITRLSLPAR